ncbi:hypothetical protein Salat_0032300 [Sesamum alatum]|uniref:Uncharacterized protein n=1 Tax=Sesamum alatum TaxID=300844 RepID=A0AAE2CWT5_9LAMI|nr:hypothetical protein Salat_0032300 [Sesamum alatum]
MRMPTSFRTAISGSHNFSRRRRDHMPFLLGENCTRNLKFPWSHTPIRCAEHTLYFSSNSRKKTATATAKQKRQQQQQSPLRRLRRRRNHGASITTRSREEIRRRSRAAAERALYAPAALNGGIELKLLKCGGS